MIAQLTKPELSMLEVVDFYKLKKGKEKLNIVNSCFVTLAKLLNYVGLILILGLLG